MGETNVGNNYITDVFETLSQSATSNEQKPIKWYQFKIPVREFENRFGGITDFRSIRFMRLFHEKLYSAGNCEIRENGAYPW